MQNTAQMSSSSQDILVLMERLRTESPQIISATERLAAFKNVGLLWQSRLKSGWEPEEQGTFPFAQVRRGLAALAVDMLYLRHWFDLSQRTGKSPFTESGVVALILAGNTPLMSWPPLIAALLAGHRVFVKMAHDERQGTAWLIKSLKEVAPNMAHRVYATYFAGDSAESETLLNRCDAVIAYGSDSTIAALRSKTPAVTPFFGFGHAISMGIVDAKTRRSDQTALFATDLLMYGQSGCLSPQTVFVLGDAADSLSVAQQIAATLPETAYRLDVTPVQYAATAQRIRNARDMALFDGATLSGDTHLRWTVAAYPNELFPKPVGYGFLSVVPLSSLEKLPDLLGDYNGKVSGVAVEGRIGQYSKILLQKMGVTYFCAAGQMQTPYIDWPNGGINLLAELMVP